MSPSHFLALDAPVGAEAVAKFLHTFGAALTGQGPAILPLPAGPTEVRERLLAFAEPDRALEYDDITLLVPTSGSAGPPKVTLLSRTAVMASVQATHEALGGPGRWLLTMPTTHIAGLQVLARSIVSGFPPAVVDLVDGFQTRRLVEAVDSLLDAAGTEPRYTALVPTQLHRVLESDDAVSALMAFDAVLLGGAAPPPRLVERAHSAGIPLVQSYGMTETCGGCVYDGVPLPGVRVTFGDDRRIQLSGPMMFSGYRRDPELTSRTLRDGTILTSDFGHLDEQRRLVIDGRLDDAIITGGINVSCTAVEQVLIEHPLIRDIAVVGIPDEEWGERVVAIAVVAKELTLAALRTFGQRQLEVSTLPRQLITVVELPLLPTGTLDRIAAKRIATSHS